MVIASGIEELQRAVDEKKDGLILVPELAKMYFLRFLVERPFHYLKIQNAGIPTNTSAKLRHKKLEVISISLYELEEMTAPSELNDGITSYDIIGEVSERDASAAIKKLINDELCLALPLYEYISREYKSKKLDDDGYLHCYYQ